MKSAVENYVRSCPFCQLHKGRTALTEGHLCSILPRSKPFELVGIDHLGPLQKSGHVHIIFLIDYLSKW